VKRGLLALSLLLACNGTPSEPAPATVTTAVVVKPQVSWPASSSIDERALASLGDSRSQLSRSPVPVLAPKGDGVLDAIERPTVIVEGEYYVITARNHGATISIQGTRAAHRYDGVDPHPGNKSLRKGTGFVTVNEGIRSASFIENGVAYSVDVECAEHTDVRCTSEAFVTELTNQLVYVGGGSAR
jgi:hypothetical protein